MDANEWNIPGHWKASARDTGPTLPSTTPQSDQTGIPELPVIEGQLDHLLIPVTNENERRIHDLSEKQTQALDNLDNSADTSKQSGGHVPNEFDFALLSNQAAEPGNTGLLLEISAINAVNLSTIRAGSTAVGISAEARSTPAPSDNVTTGYNVLELNAQTSHPKATAVDGFGRRCHMSIEREQVVPKTTSKSTSEDSPEWSDVGVSTATSPGDDSVGAVSEELDEMEIDGPAGAFTESNKSWNDFSRAREETSILNPTHSYPTPGSDSPATPIPAEECIESHASFSPSETAKQEFILPCSPASPADNSACGNTGSAPNASNLASTGQNRPSFGVLQDCYPDLERDHNSTFATEDDLGDKEIESILEDAYEFLKDSSDIPNLNSATEPKTPARAGESPEDSQLEDGPATDAAVSELALASVVPPTCSTNIISPASCQTDDDVGVGYSKNRKRKRTPEADDPETRRASPNSTLPNGSIQATASQSSLLVDDEDLVVSDDLSSLSSCPGSPPPEPADYTATQEPSPMDVTFSTLTERERSQVRRTGDHLLMPDFSRFLEQHSRHWFTSGFWNGATWKINKTSRTNSPPDRAGLISYLVTLQHEDEMQYLRLLVSRVLLFLLYEREIECERRHGTAVTALKKTATNNLCHTSGLSGLEKRKIKKSFHNNKRIGECWWWCVRFFGPSFLLRCSREAAKKM
ncbi:hypothetical protein N7540_010960 [Penicillium herquei]|nr:hypothetical protein N7540_010960 [Penicillium herquei]